MRAQLHFFTHARKDKMTAVVFARKGPVHIEQHLRRSGEHVACYRSVIGVQKASVPVDEDELHGRRACIDAEVDRALRVSEALAGNPFGCVAGIERLDVSLVGEERGQAGKVALRSFRFADAFLKFGKRHVHDGASEPCGIV